MISLVSLVLATAAAVAPAQPPSRSNTVESVPLVSQAAAAAATAVSPSSSVAAQVPVAPSVPPVLPPPTPAEIMEIPPALQQLLNQRVIRPHGARDGRLEALVHLIFDDDGLALRYESAATHTVAETYASGTANCLSFSLLFISLARASGIGARAQEIGQVLSWYQDQRTIYNFGHINVQIRLDGRMGTVDLDSSVLMDRRGPTVISDARLFAHYYSNRGSELMGEDQYTASRTYFERALAMDDTLPNAWNNLGVLEVRENDPVAAARDYSQALRLKRDHIASLSNMINLYRRQGDTASADLLIARLQSLRQVDPFHQFMLGRQSESQGDYGAAARYYRRAISLYPSAHQFHFGLARVYFLRGDNRLAEKELMRARSLGPDSEKQRYQAKLDSLHRLRRDVGLSALR
ncbi:MAG TPA: tetratricopeptide repeat protein [Stenotrophomonas sp.]|jgi:tetratricopeptide (TPR) repeat protein